MGRRPDLSRDRKAHPAARRRARARQAAPCPPRVLRRHRRTAREPDVRAALHRFRDAGVAAVCVAEAFSPDDPSNETAVAAIARELGLPVCTSTDLSGLYGLELRTVTAALERVDPADRGEHGVVRRRRRQGRRHRCAGDGHAQRRRRDRSRRVPRGAGAHAVLGPVGVGGRRAALHRRHRRGRPRGRRDVDEHRRDPRRTPVDVLRARRIARDRVAQSSTCASSASPAARCCACAEDTSTASVRGRHTSPVCQYACLMPASAFAGATVASAGSPARRSRRLRRDLHRRRRRVSR